MKSNLLIGLCLAGLCGCFVGCSGQPKKPVAQATTVRSHLDLMNQLGAKPHPHIRTVGILLYDNYNTLDAIGPYQVLSEMMGVKVFFVAKQRGPVKNMGGVEIKVDKALADVDSLDILVVPGGFQATYQMTKDTAVLDWIRRIDKTTVYTTSVCTGSWILGAAGLLKDKNATTHWYGKDLLRGYGANVQDKRWVRDGKLWTSAGVTAGMDMSLALVNEIMGEKYTKAAMLDLEYDPQPPLKAGSEQNTDPAVIATMRQMYDLGMERVKITPVAATAAGADTHPTASAASFTDPVCGMTVDKRTSLTAEHDGHRYGFCSEGCRRQFAQQPTQFIRKQIVEKD